MKKLLIVLFSLLSLQTFSQRWETIKGNGQLKKENREISAFTSLASRGAMDVEITYGKSNSITIEADENLLPYIETSVENGQLTIRPKQQVNLKSNSRMVVHISMTIINSLQQSGSGNIMGNGAFVNDGKTNISLAGSGNITIGFRSFKDLDLSISGSGNIDLTNGETNNILAQISGSGNIDCSSISSNDVVAKISGSGNIKVNAKNSLDTRIAGSGNVYYKGDVTNIKSKVLGSGKVSKM
jgi:hypothetical protein